MFDLKGILAYRNVYALSDIVTDNQLKATHYACWLSHGLWGVWTVGGRFLRFYSRKSEIKDTYPDKVWKTRAATWTLAKVTDEEPGEVRASLSQNYGSALP